MQTRIVQAEMVPALVQRVAELQQLDSMRHIPEAELKLLSAAAGLRMFEPHELIVAEHSIARHVFIIISGNAEQTMRDRDGIDVMLALLGRGDLFGEGGLFGVRYRRTSVRATTRCVVLQLRYADLQPYLSQLSEFYATLRLRFRERLLQTTLARVPLLSSLTTLERLMIAQQLDDRRVERGAEIICAGGLSEGLYIVAEGQATVMHNGRTLAVLAPGDLFGEMSLLDRAPHEASIVALTPVHLLILPQPTFEYLLTQRPDIAEALHHLAALRRQIDRSPEHIAVTEQLLETGIIRGEYALVRHTEQCAPNCRRCEDACATRFEKPRLHFNGTLINGREAANTCRHCQWSAECVEACPEDAFRLDSDGHLVITDKCIGCGACITACPYDAINDVPVYAQVTNPVQWLLRSVHRQQPIMMRANKCDACSGYEDHACIAACPTGALQWVPIEELYQPKVVPALQSKLITRA